MRGEHPANRRENQDPELAILVELEAELERELRTIMPAQRDRPRTKAPWDSARVIRRALVLVALVSLIGASAWAGRAVIDGNSHGTSLSPLAEGGRGSEHWRLQAYAHGSAICQALFLTQSVASACGAPPHADAISLISAVSATQRFVAGLTGARVRQVLVRAGSKQLVLPTHTLPSRHTAGARPGAANLRWFLAILPGEGSVRIAPVQAYPRTQSGRPLAGATLDCSTGGASALCQHAANHAASGG